MRKTGTAMSEASHMKICINELEISYYEVGSIFRLKLKATSAVEQRTALTYSFLARHFAPRNFLTSVCLNVDRVEPKI